ncbi:uncharacterized protein IL334_003059 [Kwoniella shivajii]|uniref:GATA-type domain-containing protein n=1 Tax=Kwoniella shivajii TaxID=564305 RepID=A0ABZ1CWV2_9TREE|nr:hypothetical protein IL334_003059 [Kwoniella shivajii]
MSDYIASPRPPSTISSPIVEQPLPVTPTEPLQSTQLVRASSNIVPSQNLNRTYSTDFLNLPSYIFNTVSPFPTLTGVNNSDNSMSSAPKGMNHHHSASFTYGSSQLQNQISSGISQERSTASPTQPTGLNAAQQYSWPPKTTSPVPPYFPNATSSPSAHVQVQPPTSLSQNVQQPHYSPTQALPQLQPLYSASSNPASVPTMMLPPLRIPKHSDPRINPAYASSSLSPYQNNFGYPPSYANVNQYSQYQRPPTGGYFSGHVFHYSNSSSAGTDPWTPLSPTGNGGISYFNSSPVHQPYAAPPPHQPLPTTPSTIQPSAFPSWQVPSEIKSKSGYSLNSPLGMPGSENSRLLDRRSSTPGGQSTERWDRPSMVPSSNTSDHPSSDIDDEAKSEVKPEVTYTTDAEVKQTPEIKRMCYNCDNRSPPSWRKSVIHPGRILCNKCGIFERTHQKSRPRQNDDQKLRRSGQSGGISGSANRRNKQIPPQLQVMKDEGDGSPVPLSPYSAIPSQATPLSATFSTSSSYTSPSEHLLSSGAAGHRRVAFNAYNHSSPSQHEVNTPVSLIDGIYTNSNFASSRVNSGHHAHGSSPYAHAYAKRPYPQSLRFDAIQSSSSSLWTSQIPQMGENISPSWMANTRRHSDISIHPSLLSNTSSKSSFGDRPERQSNNEDQDKTEGNDGVKVESV